MRQLVLLGFGAVAFLLAIPQQGFACSCMGHPVYPDEQFRTDVRKAVAGAELVFAGEVTAMDTFTVTFEPVSVWKGTLAASVVMRTGARRVNEREIMISTCYDYVVQLRCFCDEDVTKATPVQVRNGFGGFPDPASEPTRMGLAKYSTVDSIFAELRALLISSPARLEVVFDPTYGYPMSISYDRRADVADDELTLAITDFKRK